MFYCGLNKLHPFTLFLLSVWPFNFIQKAYIIYDNGDDGGKEYDNSNTKGKEN